MADSKNPFAKRNGRIITINDLNENENGLRCNCKCPVCDGTFVARMGEVRSWHFAHSGEPCDAAKQIINSSYQLVEQAIREKGYVIFPGLYVYCNLTHIGVSYYDAYSFSSFPKAHYEKLFDKGPTAVKTVELINNSNDISVALIINDILAVKLSIDTEYCIEKNINRYEDLATLCIDINDAIYKDNSKKLAAMIVDGVDNKRWIYSPRIDKWIEPLENERLEKYNLYLERQRKETEERRKEAEARKAQEAKRQEEYKKKLEQEREEELKKLAEKQKWLEEHRGQVTSSDNYVALPKKRMVDYRPKLKWCCICNKQNHPEDVMFGRNSKKYYCHRCIEEKKLNWKEL